MAPPRKVSYPANLNVRMTATMVAAVAEFAAENEISTSEAARWLIGIGIDQVMDQESGGFRRFVDEDDDDDQEQE